MSQELATFSEAPIKGVKLFWPKTHYDNRGSFVKIFFEPAFKAEGILFRVREQFYSTSAAGVIRGMHFQSPDRAQAKAVSCTEGQILDVVLDLRWQSPTYGKSWSVLLEARKPSVVYIPEGVAHGFLSLSEKSTLLYSCSEIQSPENEGGIRWDSFGFPWPERNPILSERDKAFPPISGFVTPFTL